MTDHDERLSRRYRELARDEPPAAIDAAIRAAAARAVRSRPRRNWAGPVSIAAVLVLGIGVSLRMQMEQPGIETSVPGSEQYAPPATPPAPVDVTTKPLEPQREQAAGSRVAPPAPALKRKIAPEEKPVAQDKAVAAPESRPYADSFTPAPVPPPAASPPPPAKPASPPAAFTAPESSSIPAAPPASTAPATSAAPAPAPFAAPAAPAAPAARVSPSMVAPSEQNVAPARQPATEGVAPSAPRTPMADPSGAAVTTGRTKSEAAATESAEKRSLLKSAIDSRTAELDRIARLRAEGRHAEADKALDEFRRRYPDYRIPEDTWDRVKPR